MNDARVKELLAKMDDEILAKVDEEVAKRSEEIKRIGTEAYDAAVEGYITFIKQDVEQEYSTARRFLNDLLKEEEVKEEPVEEKVEEVIEEPVVEEPVVEDEVIEETIENPVPEVEEQPVPEEPAVEVAQAPVQPIGLY